MALINCPECGKAFSDKAATCPNCAYPLTEMDRIRLGITDGHAAMEKANEMFAKDNMRSALDIYLALAEEGNREACYKAGYMLCNGYGVKTDNEKGVKYLKKAAENNYPKALFSLACHYDSEKDTENALHYFKQAEEFIESFEPDEQAHIQFKIGMLLSEELNFDDKIQYLEHAVSMGGDYAKKHLAKLYHKKGEDLFIAQQYSRAADYFQYAIDCGDDQSTEHLADCYCQMGAEEPDKEKQLLLLIKAAQIGSNTAKLALSEYYYENSDDNLLNLEKSAYYGNIAARRKLSAYYNEKGVENYSKGDRETARSFFERAVEFANPEAAKNLAVIYNQMGVQLYSGDQVETDYKKAEEFFNKAKELGSEDAQKNLGILYNQYGLIYQHGNNVKRNFDKSEEYFLKALDCGHEAALKNVIMLYVTGYFNFKHGINGFHKHKNRAMEYLSKAKQLSPEMVSEIGGDYLKRADDLLAEGISKDNYKKINSFLKRASRLGDEDVSEKLINFYKTVSSYYKHGKKGFDKSKTRANHYMHKAAELGDKEAIKKYKPPKKKKSSIFAKAFEAITGTSVGTIKNSQYGSHYKYKYYNHSRYYKK